MNTILARFNIVAGKEAEAEEAIKTMAAAVQASEQGTLTYIFHRSRKEPSAITVFEIYADDDASTAHRGTEQMTKFASHFGSIFDAQSVKIDRLDRIAGFRARRFVGAPSRGTSASP